jgi:drug/metabolite transporter (DMT)-like permease
MPDAIRLAIVSSTPHASHRQSSRLHRLAVRREEFGQAGDLFIIGLCGLFLYNVGLSSAHPIITAAILNLSPFWAALVAIIISRKSIPVSPLVFFGCFAVAFVGAMIVAWSQIDTSYQVLFRDLVESIFHSRWAYAIPIPIFFALSGTLVGKW